MSRWFRFYDGALDDPKVQSLPPEIFKTWINLLCAASRNDGLLPEADLPFLLRIDAGKSKRHLEELIGRGLIDLRQGGYEPHNWDARQFKSDVSTERVKRHRSRQRNVSGNVSVIVSGTSPYTEADTETKQKESSEPIGSGDGAPIDLEKLTFKRGKEVLGASAGGVIARLKREKAKTWSETLGIIEEAAKKQSPMEWVQGVLRRQDPPEVDPYRNVDCSEPTPDELAMWKAQGLS